MARHQQNWFIITGFCFCQSSCRGSFWIVSHQVQNPRRSEGSAKRKAILENTAVKNDAPKLLASDQAGVALAVNAWTRFWFTPTSVTGLHCLRVLSGLLFICWLLSFVGSQEAFFSTTGWFDREAYLQLQQGDPGMAPPIGWSMLYLAGDSSEIFQALYWGSLVILALFTLGVATRITGFLPWVIVVMGVAT